MLKVYLNTTFELKLSKLCFLSVGLGRAEFIAGSCKNSLHEALCKTVKFCITFSCFKPPGLAEVILKLPRNNAKPIPSQSATLR